MTNFSFVHFFHSFKKMANKALFVCLVSLAFSQTSFASCDTASARSTMDSNFTSDIYLYPNVIPYIVNCIEEFGTEYKNAKEPLNIKNTMNLSSTESIVDALSQGQYTDGSTDLPPLQRAIFFAKAIDSKCKKDKNVSSSGSFSGAGKGRTSEFVKLCAEIAKLAATDVKEVASSGTDIKHACSGVEPSDKIDGCYDGDELQCAQALRSPKISSNSECEKAVRNYLAGTEVADLARECAEDATKTNPKCKQLCREANEIYLFDENDKDCKSSTISREDNPEGEDGPGGGGSGDGGDDTDISTASTGDDDEITQNDVNQLAGMASQFRPGQTQYGLKAQDDGDKYQSSTNQGNGGDPRFQGGISGNANPTLTAISQRPRATDLFPSGGGSGGQGGAGQSGGGGGSPAVGGPQNNQAGGNKGGGNKRRRGGRRRNRLTDVLDGLKGNRFMGAAISEPGGDGGLDPKYKNKIAENKKDKEKKAANLDPLRAAYRKGLNRNTAGQGDGFLPALYFPMIDENFSEIKERQSYTIEKGQSF